MAPRVPARRRPQVHAMPARRNLRRIGHAADRERRLLVFRGRAATRHLRRRQARCGLLALRGRRGRLSRRQRQPQCDGDVRPRPWARAAPRAPRASSPLARSVPTAPIHHGGRPSLLRCSSCGPMRQCACTRAAGRSITSSRRYRCSLCWARCRSPGRAGRRVSTSRRPRRGAHHPAGPCDLPLWL